MSIAIYLRGTAASRARQSAECEAFAAAHYPGVPVEVYDDGESHGRRPELARLVAGLEAGTLTAAIVADTIRLMRPPELLQELAQRGPRPAWLHGVHGGDFDLSTSDGRFDVAMFASSVALHDAERDAEARFTRARHAASAFEREHPGVAISARRRRLPPVDRPPGRQDPGQ